MLYNSMKEVHQENKTRVSFIKQNNLIIIDTYADRYSIIKFKSNLSEIRKFLPSEFFEKIKDKASKK